MCVKVHLESVSVSVSVSVIRWLQKVTIPISIICGGRLRKTFCNHLITETDTETETDSRRIFTHIDKVGGGGDQRSGILLSRPNFLHFHAVFGNKMLVLPLTGANSD